MKSRTFLSIPALTLLALMLSCISAEAENPVKVSARVGYSAAPVMAINLFNRQESYAAIYNQPLKRYYGDYVGQAHSCGSFAVAADIDLLKWLSMNVDLAFTPVWHDRFHGRDDGILGRENGLVINLLPMAKFYYKKWDNCFLYGRVGFGFAKYCNFKSLQYSYRDSNGIVNNVNRSFIVAAQLAPVGVEFGKKVFGFAEFGFGTVYIGFQGGVGYRF